MNTDGVSFQVWGLRLKAAGGQEKEDMDMICCFIYLMSEELENLYSQVLWRTCITSRLNISNGDLLKPERLF